MILLPALLVPIVFCMALVRLYRIPARLARRQLHLPRGRWGLLLLTVLAYALLLGWTVGLAAALLRALLTASESLAAVLELWGWMLAYPLVYFLTAWVFFYGLKKPSPAKRS